MIELGRSCSRHRPALLDFIDHGEVRRETSAALVHLDRCDRCREAVESTVLTITALRRYGASLDGVDPAPDAWPRLAARVTSWRRRPVSMSPLAGLGMSVAMVVALILPFRLGPSELAGAVGSAGAAGPESTPDAIVRPRSRIPIDDSPNLATDRSANTRAIRQVVGDDIHIAFEEVSPNNSDRRPARRI